MHAGWARALNRSSLERAVRHMWSEAGQKRACKDPNAPEQTCKQPKRQGDYDDEIVRAENAIEIVQVWDDLARMSPEEVHVTPGGDGEHDCSHLGPEALFRVWKKLMETILGQHGDGTLWWSPVG